MGSSDSDDEILKQYLISARTRRRRGLLGCAFGVAFVAVQIWMISLHLERARSFDELLAVSTEIDPAFVPKVGPVQVSTHISLSIALAVANSLIGVVCIALGF